MCRCCVFASHHQPPPPPPSCYPLVYPPPHTQILQLYKDYIDPDFTWANFTVEEQAKVIVAPRSNNLLDTQRVRE